MNSIRIEITNCCNLRCRMCPQATSINRNKMMMPDSLFDKIIEDVSKHLHGVNVSFHVSGEPLLHKSIDKFVKKVKSHSLVPWIVTNATLLTEDISKRLIYSGLDKISFSFEGVNKEIYESVRIGAKYEEVLSNIETFLSINSKMGKPVWTELVCIDLPEIKVSLIDEFLHNMKPKFNVINKSGYFDWLGKIGNEQKEITSGFGCRVMNTDLNILVDGKVVPCCMDACGEMAYGDFSHMTFSEIMLSNRRKDLKSKIESGNFSGLACSRCFVPTGKHRKVRASQA